MKEKLRKLRDKSHSFEWEAEEDAVKVVRLIAIATIKS